MDLLERSEISDDVSLIAQTREKIIENCLDAVASPLKVLILDDHSKKIISAAVKMTDLTGAGVSLLEKLELKRQPLPKMDAIYFVSPTEATVKLMIKDWQDEDKPMYKAAHIFFTGRLEEFLMQRIAGARLAQNIKTLVELKLEYIVKEPRVFTTNQPGSLAALYSPTGGDPKGEQARIARRLAGVCATLGEYPIIRYAKSSAHCINIAQQVADVLGDDTTAEGADRPLLLILDRAHDLITPFVHEFSYQAMVLDLLDDVAKQYPMFLHRFKTQDDEEVEKEVLLDDSDAVWRTMAAMHIENGRQWVASTTREFVESSKTSTKMDKAKGDKGVKAIAELVKAVPKYQKLYSKFSIHISLTKRCMDSFNRNGLEKVCDVEQSIATGANDANKKLDASDLCKLVNEILEDSEVSHADKFRLVLLLNAACDHADAKVKKTVQSARLSSEEEETLKYLIAIKNASARKKQQRIPDLYDQLAAGKLDTKDYPFLNKEDESKFASGSITPAASKRKDAPAASASSGSKWAQAANKASATPAKGSGKKGGISKYIIFIAGGVTYQEIREAYLKSANDKVQCYIGSTAIYRPTDLIKAISKFGHVNADEEEEALPTKSPRSLSSGAEDSSEEKPKPAKRAAPAAKKAGGAKKAASPPARAAKKQESSEEDDSDDGSSDESSEAPKPKRTVAKKAGSTTQATPVKKAVPAKKVTAAKRRNDSDSD